MLFEFYLRDVTDRNAVTLETSFCLFCFMEFSVGGQNCVEELLENTVPTYIVLGFHSSTTEDVDQEALWLAFVTKVRI